MKSIKSKLLASYFLISLIIVLILGIVFSWFVRDFYLDTLKERLSEEAYITGELLKPFLPEDESKQPSLSELKDTTYILKEKTNARITLISPNGIVWSDTEADTAYMENHLERPEIQQLYSNQKGHTIRYSDTLNTDMFYVAVPVEDEENLLGFLRLALPLSALERTLGQIRLVLVGVALGALAIASVLGHRLATTLTVPLRNIAQMAERISRGNLESRIQIDSNDETGSLSNSINRMARSLEQQWQEISMHKEQLETVLNSMVDGIIVFDEENRAIMANPAAEKLFNITSEQLLQHHDLEIIRNLELHRYISWVSQEQKLSEMEIETDYPQKMTLKVSLIPINIKRENKSGVLTVFQNITELRRLEKVRSDFAANVSHELKTPLTSIRGFAETLKNEAQTDPETVRHFSEIIFREATQLQTLIEDIMRLSQLESGKIELNFELVEIHFLINDLLYHFDDQLNEFQVCVETQSTLPSIKADYNLLFQALSNILDNAIKYTAPGGQIKIGATEEKFPYEEGNWVRIYVADTGIGIPKEAQARIFERFYRVDRDRSRKKGGTGLGLAIVKHLVELHQGKLELESKEGKGTRISIIVPSLNNKNDLHLN